MKNLQDVLMQDQMPIELHEVRNVAYVQESIRTAEGMLITDRQYFCCNLTNGEFIEIGAGDVRFVGLQTIFADALTKLPADEGGSLLLYEAADSEDRQI